MALMLALMSKKNRPVPAVRRWGLCSLALAGIALAWTVRADGWASSANRASDAEA